MTLLQDLSNVPSLLPSNFVSTSNLLGIFSAGMASLLSLIQYCSSISSGQLTKGSLVVGIVSLFYVFPFAQYILLLVVIGELIYYFGHFVTMFVQECMSNGILSAWEGFCEKHHHLALLVSSITIFLCFDKNFPFFGHLVFAVIYPFVAEDILDKDEVYFSIASILKPFLDFLIPPLSKKTEL